MTIPPSSLPPTFPVYPSPYRLYLPSTPFFAPPHPPSLCLSFPLPPISSLHALPRPSPSLPLELFLKMTSQKSIILRVLCFLCFVSVLMNNPHSLPHDSLYSNNDRRPCKCAVSVKKYPIRWNVRLSVVCPLCFDS